MNFANAFRSYPPAANVERHCGQPYVSLRPQPINRKTTKDETL